MTPGFPLIGIGGPSDGIPSVAPTGWQAPAPTQQTNPFDIGGALGKAGGAIGRTYDKISGALGNSFLSSLFGSDYQYLTGIIGLVLIIGGIFLLRPVRETVVNVSKTAAKGAAMAA